MLLSELALFKATDGVSFHAALRELIADKELKTASGSRGQVIWAKDKSYVWKFWFSDAKYERFLRFVSEHKGSKHLPKILSRVRVEDVSQFKGMLKAMKCSYVKLEKLDEMEPGALSDALDCMFNADWEKSDIPASITTLLDAITEKMIPGHSDADLDEIHDAILKHKEFFELCLELLRAGANDLHSDNVMMRGDVPVITDPFC